MALAHLETGDLELARAALLESEVSELAETAADGTIPSAALISQIWAAFARMPPSGGTSAMSDDLLEDFIEVRWPPPTAALGDKRPDNEQDSVDGKRRPSTAWEALTTEKTLDETQQSGDTEPEAPEAKAPEAEAPVAEAPEPEVEAPEVEPRAADPTSEQRRPPRFALRTDEVRHVPPLMDTDHGWLRLWPRGGQQGCPVVIRGDLLVSARGAVSFDTVDRRARGATAGQFEVKGAPLWLLGGEGEAEVRVPPSLSVTVLELSQRDPVLYLREEALVAFAGNLHWENGLLPEQVACVRFCGTGPVAVVHSGELHRVELSGDAPVLVRRDALCGWIGEVVVSWAGISAPRGLRLYRCDGRGAALVDCGAMGRGPSDVSQR